MNKNYSANRQFADEYTDQLKTILGDHLSDIVKIEVAPDTLDQEEATDMVIQLKSGMVACRVRRDNIKFRDWTIRTRSFYGKKTEIDKLREGYGDWYLYGWAKDGKISRWMLIDLLKVRISGLLDKSRIEIPNTDGGRTKFIAISVPELIEADCLIAQQFDPRFVEVK